MQELAPTPQPMPIENPPPLTPALTPQEVAVLNGDIRQKLLGVSTVMGAAAGAVGGLVIGGIWSFVTKTHWPAKLAGSLVGFSAIGALVSRMTWGKDNADKAAERVQAELANGNPELQAAARESLNHINGQASTPTPQQPPQTPLPQPQIQASTVELAAALDTQTPQIS